MKLKKCAFTGHRPQSLPFGFNETDERCIALKQTLRAEIIRLIEHEGVTHFISGMALGVDMYAAEIVLGLKSRLSKALLLKVQFLVKVRLRSGLRNRETAILILPLSVTRRH